MIVFDKVAADLAMEIHIGISAISSLPMPIGQSGRLSQAIVVDDVARMHKEAQIVLQHGRIDLKAVVTVLVGESLAGGNGEHHASRLVRRRSRAKAAVERLAAVGGARIRVNFVETEDNIHEREAVRVWAASLGARFFHRRQHTRGGTIGSARAPEGHHGCGIFGSVTFISADGVVLPCVNDVRAEGRFGVVGQVSWADVLAWKREVIRDGRWFAACHSCDDDYRWVLLGRGGLEGT